MNTVFVYAKDGEIRVLSLEQAIKHKYNLIGYGWEHTATIDPCLWIEKLHNSLKGRKMISAIKELSKIKEL